MYDGLKTNASKNSESALQTVDINAYINPQSYFISFGGMSYTKVYDQTVRNQIWENVQPYIFSALSNYETFESIDEKTYVEAFSTKSILLKMPLELRFSDLAVLYGIEDVPKEMEEIIPIEYLIVSDQTRELYLRDGRSNQYYKVKSKTYTHDIPALIESIKSREYIEYRKVSDRFSLESTVSENENYMNYTLIPYQYDYLVPNLQVQTEVNLDSAQFDDQIRTIAKAVFGNRFDFIKRLEDINGSVIFMYGYGDKALTVTPEGVVSYNQKYSVNEKTRISVAKALSLACGNLEQFGILPSGVNLIKYRSELESGIVVQTFSFNYKLGNYEVVPQNSLDADIKVVVKGDQVIYITKNVKSYIGDAILERALDYDKMYDIDECITSNFLEVSIYYLQDNNIYDASMNSIQYYFSIRSAISSIEMNYYQLDETHMVPVWAVNISGRTYIFDAYTGNIMTSYR
ncbi:YycH protein [Fusibacter sp. 3D3]|nr:YycH protein [Fusibacter sp. 3D3]